MVKINQSRLHKEMFSYDLEVHEKRGCTPEHLYSINCTLYETGRRENPIPQPYYDRAVASDMICIGRLRTYIREEPERSYEGINLRPITHVVVGATIEDVLEQFENLLQAGDPNGNQYIAGTVEEKEAINEINIKRRGW
ncbi:hypothetical protein RBD99_002781 [Salmonella enterica]|nr:hypothetical protein [Salmonella enterica]